MDFLVPGITGVHLDDGATYVNTFPRRYILGPIATSSYDGEKFERDPSPCDVCRKEIMVWWTFERIWNSLPSAFRNTYLCVGCFRRISRITQSK